MVVPDLVQFALQRGNLLFESVPPSRRLGEVSLSLQTPFRSGVRGALPLGYDLVQGGTDLTEVVLDAFHSLLSCLEVFSRRVDTLDCCRAGGTRLHELVLQPRNVRFLLRDLS